MGWKAIFTPQIPSWSRQLHPLAETIFFVHENQGCPANVCSNQSEEEMVGRFQQKLDGSY